MTKILWLANILKLVYPLPVFYTKSRLILEMKVLYCILVRKPSLGEVIHKVYRSQMTSNFIQHPSFGKFKVLSLQGPLNPSEKNLMPFLNAPTNENHVITRNNMKVLENNIAYDIQIQTDYGLHSSNIIINQN